MFFKQGKDEIPNCKPNLVEIFSRRKKISVKTQGKMKMTKMKSCIFSKIWKEISLKNISPRNFFFFSWRNIFESCLQILENPKNFMILFFHPLNLSGVVLGENLSSLLSKGLSGKSVLITFISSGLRRKLFLPFILKLLQIQSQINHNPINRFH